MKSEKQRLPESSMSSPKEAFQHALEEAAHVLPDQGPLSVFVHHNTLHAFEHLPFHEAVRRAAEVFGAQPYMAEAAYQSEYARGRIDDSDIDGALSAYVDTKQRSLPEPLSADIVRRLAMRHGIDEVSDKTLAWRIEEDGLLQSLRRDVPEEARKRIMTESAAFLTSLLTNKDKNAPISRLREVLTGETDEAEAEELLLHSAGVPLDRAALGRLAETRPEVLTTHALWGAARRLTHGHRSSAPKTSFVRHRDYLLRATGMDTDALIHPIMISLMSAYLDEGLAYWPMPERQGLYRAFRSLMTAGSMIPVGWLRELRAALLRQEAANATPEEVAIEILKELGVAEDEYERYLKAMLLALPGWAGMMHRLERRPADRAEGAPPASLVDYVAVRLLYERAALKEISRQAFGEPLPLGDLRKRLSPQRESQADQPGRPEQNDRYRATYGLFQVFQLAGIPAGVAHSFTRKDAGEVLDVLTDFDELTRRGLWHEAYERHHRHQILNGIAINRREEAARAEAKTPTVQIVFCIDDREESIRRHVEELRPDFETFGAAGFFGLAIEYHGFDHGNALALCPAVQTPAHAVKEVPVEDDHTRGHARKSRRKRLGRALRFGQVGSRSLFRGLMLSAGMGIVSAVPLLTRVVAPRLAGKVKKGVSRALLPQPRTELTAFHDEQSFTESGKPLGFTLTEATDRIERMLRDLGMTKQFAPLIFFLGHGSTSWNNPLRSAYDCGACSGNRGEANARLFALLANDPDVRAELRPRGIEIPDTTFFIGGLHDTSTDAVELYDLDQVPPTHAERLREAQKVFDQARMLDAHERCRRFARVPLTVSPKAALRHVESRAENLAEPRPEYGHCTNAICIVGRRSLSKGLFLDRRAFLVSYDPTQDPKGNIVERILAAVGPVGAGISLEYYFSFVDNDRYGCGTKLPHNVTSLLGIMNGHKSDLRTGLPRQMVEIHEPIRLLTIVESTPEVLLQVAERQPAVRQLVVNRWIQLVSVDPSSGAMHVFTDRGFEPFTPDQGRLPTFSSSTAYYRGHRQHLPPARIVAASHG